MRLATQLMSMERYAEAEAVLEAIRDHHQQIGPGHLLRHDRNATDILHCVINTRRMRYAESLQMGKGVAHRFGFPDLETHVKQEGKFTKAYDEISPSRHPMSSAIKSRASRDAPKNFPGVFIHANSK